MQQQAQAGGARSPWIAIIGCALVMTIVIALTMVGLGVILPQWIAELSLSGGQAMLVVTSISLLSGFGGIAVGVLVGRMRAWLLLLIGVMAGTLALVLASHAHSFAALLLTLVPLGALGNALTGPVVGQTIAVRRIARPGFAIAIITMGMSVGAITGPLITAGLLAGTDWRGALRIAAALVAIVGGAIVLLMVRGDPGAEAPTATRHSGTEEASDKTLADIVLTPTFLGAALLQFPLMALMSALFFNLVLINGEMGGSLAAGAAMMSMVAAVGLVGTFVTGLLLDRVRHVAVMAFIVVVMAMGHLILVVAQSPALLQVAALLISLGNSAVLPLVPALVARRFEGADFQRANGLLQPILFGSNLGALAAGILHDATHRYDTTFAWLLLLYVPVAFGVGLLLRGAQQARLAAA